MRKIDLISCVLIICFFLGRSPLVFSIGGYTPSNSSIEGSWQGTLDVPGSKLRIVFRITKNSDSTLKTVLDSPDQGAKDIPVDETIFRGDSVTFIVKSVLGSYQGRFKEDGKTLEGFWKQAGMSFPLVLVWSEQTFEIRRPQEPNKPLFYKEEEVSINNARAGIQLAGTLSKRLSHRMHLYF